MSQKQQLHNSEYHYLNSVEEEKDKSGTAGTTDIPSGTSSIEELNPKTTLKEFYDTIMLFKKEFNQLSNEEIKAILKTQMKEELDDFIQDFHETFKDVNHHDSTLLEMLVALSHIGIEIPRPPKSCPSSPTKEVEKEVYLLDLNKDELNIDML
jgi:hypothetical protein